MIRKSMLFAVCLTLLMGQMSAADVFRFDVVLDGTQSGTGSPGTGDAEAIFDTDTGEMSINGTFDGLNGLVSNAHLHGFADPGSDGGVLFGLTFTSGVSSGNFSGMGVIAGDDASWSNTLGGRTYINVHSSTNPGGEIRGTLLNPSIVPEPGSMVVISIAGIALLTRRRR